jgi:hypothetical protein
VLVKMAVMLLVIALDMCIVRHDSLKVRAVWVSSKFLPPYAMYQLQLGFSVL